MNEPDHKEEIHRLYHSKWKFKYMSIIRSVIHLSLIKWNNNLLWVRWKYSILKRTYYASYFYSWTRIDLHDSQFTIIYIHLILGLGTAPEFIHCVNRAVLKASGLIGCPSQIDLNRWVGLVWDDHIWNIHFQR